MRWPARTGAVGSISVVRTRDRGGRLLCDKNAFDPAPGELSRAGRACFRRHRGRVLVRRSAPSRVRIRRCMLRSRCASGSPMRHGDGSVRRCRRSEAPLRTQGARRPHPGRVTPVARNADPPRTERAERLGGRRATAAWTCASCACAEDRTLTLSITQYIRTVRSEGYKFVPGGSEDT